MLYGIERENELIPAPKKRHRQDNTRFVGNEISQLMNISTKGNFINNILLAKIPPLLRLRGWRLQKKIYKKLPEDDERFSPIVQESEEMSPKSQFSAILVDSLPISYVVCPV